jgi:1,5-anhydro-D-fructose reductase (1,5-anhydro-D-mannitol-forming)
MAIGWAVAGTGEHADRRLVPGIVQAENTRLVAVFSRDEERGVGFAARHGAARSYTSLEALLEDPEVEVVCIATPNHCHAQQTVMAAQAKKHVLCEKPMATTVADARHMVEVCRQNSVKLGTGFHSRHHPAHVQAQKMVASGEVGEPVLAKVQWAANFGPAAQWWFQPEAGGGALLTRGIHAIDLLRFLLGQEVVEVTAYTRRDNPQYPYEELALVMLKFSGGALGVMDCSHIVPHWHNDVVVYGSKARLVSQGTVGVHLRGELQYLSETETARWEFQGKGLYARQAEAFNQAILEDRQPNASGLDGLRLVEITQAVFQSAQTGQAVPV